MQLSVFKKEYVQSTSKTMETVLQPAL